MGTMGIEQGNAAPAPSAPAVPPLPPSPGAPTGAVTVTTAPAAQVTVTQGTPEAIVIQPPPYSAPPSPIPIEVIPLAGMLMSTIIAVAIGYPIVRVISRYFDRRLDRTLVSAKEVNLQIRQLQDSLDTMSIELERISEAQRFSAKLLAERSEKH